MNSENPNSHRYITIVSDPFAENSYVIHRADSSDCLIIDPGFEPDKITAVINEKKLTPRAILNTHGHVDHIAGNETMKRLYPDVPLVIGENETDKLSDPNRNLSGKYGFGIVSPPADVTVADGEEIEYAGIMMTVRETPGHSSGHVVFLCDQTDAAPLVIGGDVLFRDSIGRTDFPDGSFEVLRDAIHKHLFCLPDESIVLPGHNETTTIGRERANNPFVGKAAGYDV